MSLRPYYGKLLLFGEYTILQGSRGLAMPLPLFKGKWTREGEDPVKGVLTEIADYFLDNKIFSILDLDRFRSEVAEGWHFESTIPFGYGVGSSGALTAGIYDRYGIDKKKELSVLKKELSAIEGFFHGASSGIDPLISYLNQPVLMHSISELEKLSSVSASALSLFLVDTQITRKTAPLVELFLEKTKDINYQHRCEAELIPAVDSAIAAVLAEDTELLFEQWHEISFFQYKYFSEMIPEAFRSIWLTGLSGNDFKLKLCGAGGGGFILGIGDRHKIASSFQTLPIQRK